MGMRMGTASFRIGLLLGVLTLGWGCGCPPHVFTRSSSTLEGSAWLGVAERVAIVGLFLKEGAQGRIEEVRVNTFGQPEARIGWDFTWQVNVCGQVTAVGGGKRLDIGPRAGYGMVGMYEGEWVQFQPLESETLDTVLTELSRELSEPSRTSR